MTLSKLSPGIKAWVVRSAVTGQLPVGIADLPQWQGARLRSSVFGPGPSEGA